MKLGSPKESPRTYSSKKKPRGMTQTPPAVKVVVNEGRSSPKVVTKSPSTKLKTSILKTATDKSSPEVVKVVIGKGGTLKVSPGMVTVSSADEGVDGVTTSSPRLASSKVIAKLKSVVVKNKALREELTREKEKVQMKEVRLSCSQLFSCGPAHESLGTRLGYEAN